MSRWLAKVEAPQKNTEPLPDTQTKGDKSPSVQPEGAFCRVLSGCQVEAVEKETTPDVHAFEERSAICEYDGGLSRANAEDLAAQAQGYDNVVAFKAAKMKSQLKEYEDDHDDR